MKNSHTKIPAFTLLELLFALAISVIVIGLGYGVLSLFNKNILIIQNNYNTNTEVDLLEQRLTIDFNRYGSISYDINRLRFKNPTDSITYAFMESAILREQDTLLVTDYTYLLYLNGEEKDSGSIDGLRIQFGKYDSNSFLFIAKEKDALHYMSRDGY